MEIAGIMGNIKTGHSDALAGVCGDIAILTSAWEIHIGIKLMSDEEAFATDSIAAQWIAFAQQAALGAHT
jgi:hypothetical protein